LNNRPSAGGVISTFAYSRPITSRNQSRRWFAGRSSVESFRQPAIPASHEFAAPAHGLCNRLNRISKVPFQSSFYAVPNMREMVPPTMLKAIQFDTVEG
jgi:hypothetical protein